MSYAYRVKQEEPLIKIEPDDDECQIIDAVAPRTNFGASETVPVTSDDLDRLRKPFNSRDVAEAGTSNYSAKDQVEDAFSFLNFRDSSSTKNITSHLRSRSSSGPSQSSRPESVSSSEDDEARVPPNQSTREMLADLARKMTPHDSSKERRVERDDRRKRTYSPYRGRRYSSRRYDDRRSYHKRSAYERPFRRHHSRERYHSDEESRYRTRSRRPDTSPTRRVPVTWIPTPDTQWTNAKKVDDISDNSIYLKKLELKKKAESEDLRRDVVLESHSENWKDHRIRDDVQDVSPDDRRRSSEQSRRGPAKVATVPGKPMMYVIDEARGRVIAVAAKSQPVQKEIVVEPRYQQQAHVAIRNFQQERRAPERRERPGPEPRKPRTKHFSSAGAHKISRLNQDILFEANPLLATEVKKRLHEEFEELKKDDFEFQAKRAHVELESSVKQIECITLD